MYTSLHHTEIISTEKPNKNQKSIQIMEEYSRRLIAIVKNSAKQQIHEQK